ncbi:hepatocyte cell adhesion molecule-like [Spea bombifrons]|uniref:hepatocyte cell adhesion molecule-like n=1 Tax=Spea bombifrons TaxID=233779 RepID=UPI00234BA4DF|nr:hepatocyte cell adhesion molecule-like [Spea bombifrons]
MPEAKELKMTFSWLLILLLCSVQTASIARRDVPQPVEYVATGASFLFPGMELDENTMHELKKKGDPSWVAAYHNWDMLHDHYKNRAKFLNGSLSLANMTKEDSGTYEHLVNTTVRRTFSIAVIDPVDVPVLWKETREENQILLHCGGHGGEPLNTTFYKQGVEIKSSITRDSNDTVLHLNGEDQLCEGVYTCKTANPVSQEISDEVEVNSHDCDAVGKRMHSNWNYYYFLIISVVFVVVVAIVVYLICKRIKKRPPTRSFSGQSGNEERQQMLADSCCNTAGNSTISIPDREPIHSPGTRDPDYRAGDPNGTLDPDYRAGDPNGRLDPDYSAVDPDYSRGDPNGTLDPDYSRGDPNGTLDPDYSRGDPNGTLDPDYSRGDPNGTLDPDYSRGDLNGKVDPDYSHGDPNGTLDPDYSRGDPNGTLDPDYSRGDPNRKVDPDYSRGDPKGTLDPDCIAGVPETAEVK